MYRYLILLLVIFMAIACNKKQEGLVSKVDPVDSVIGIYTGTVNSYFYRRYDSFGYYKEQRDTTTYHAVIEVVKADAHRFFLKTSDKGFDYHSPKSQGESIYKFHIDSSVKGEYRSPNPGGRYVDILNAWFRDDSLFVVREKGNYSASGTTGQSSGLYFTGKK